MNICFNVCSYQNRNKILQSLLFIVIDGEYEIKEKSEGFVLFKEPEHDIEFDLFALKNINI